MFPVETCGLVKECEGRGGITLCPFAQAVSCEPGSCAFLTFEKDSDFIICFLHCENGGQSRVQSNLVAIVVCQ